MGKKATSAASQSHFCSLSDSVPPFKSHQKKRKTKADNRQTETKDWRAQIGKIQRKGRRQTQSTHRSVHISVNQKILLFSFRWWEIRALRSLETFCKGFLAAFKLPQGSIWDWYSKNHHPGCHFQLHVILWSSHFGDCWCFRRPRLNILNWETET